MIKCAKFAAMSSAIVILVLFLSAFAATFVQRVSGFGYGIAFMSVAPFLMPSYGEATALSGMLAVVCAIFTGIQFFRHLNWRKLAIILPTFLVVSFFAVCVVAHVDNMLLKRILGAVLIVVSLYFFFVNGKVRLRPSAAVQVSTGAVSGVMGGLFGMQGPPAVIYFISCTDDKDEYMALTQWYFIIGNVFMTFYRAGNGFMTKSVLIYFAACVPAVLLGLFVGSKVYKRISVGLLRKIVYVFIGIAGVAALLA